MNTIFCISYGCCIISSSLKFMHDVFLPCLPKELVFTRLSGKQGQSKRVEKRVGQSMIKDAIFFLELPQHNCDDLLMCFSTSSCY